VSVSKKHVAHVPAQLEGRHLVFLGEQCEALHTPCPSAVALDTECPTVLAEQQLPAKQVGFEGRRWTGEEFQYLDRRPSAHSAEQVLSKCRKSKGERDLAAECSRTRDVAEAGIAAKQFVAAETADGNRETGAPCCAGDDEGVESIDCGLVHRPEDLVDVL